MPYLPFLSHENDSISKGFGEGMLSLFAIFSHLFTCKLYVILFINVRQESKVACGSTNLKKVVSLFTEKKNTFK